MKVTTRLEALAADLSKAFHFFFFGLAVLIVTTNSVYAAGPPESRDGLSRLLLRGTVNSIQDPQINADTNVMASGGENTRRRDATRPSLPGVVSILPKSDSLGLIPSKPVPKVRTGIAWENVLKQSLYFLSIEHAFRFATERGTRAELKGPFFADWFTSVRNMRGWRDGDPFLVNYIGHPLQGTVSGYILIQNDPNGAKKNFTDGASYWKSRFKAFGWNLAYSTQFEIGPLSESSLGNVGRLPTGTSRHPQAWVDMVITPTVGTAWLIGEDALDYFLIRRLETRISNPAGRMFVRSFFNPGRSFANVMRGRWFWHRDDRPGVSHY